jgi:hypothetical protein
METQSGEPSSPASSAQMGGEADTGNVGEENAWQQSADALQQICRETENVVQTESARWMAQMEELMTREVRSAVIIAQASSQIRVWLEQVDKACKSVQDRPPSSEMDLVSLLETNSIGVEGLLEAIAGVRKIVAQIDYVQAEVEAKQAEKKAETADMAVVKAQAEMSEAESKGKLRVAKEKKREAKAASEKAKESAAKSKRANEGVDQAKAALGKVPVGAARETREAILASDDTLNATATRLKRAYLRQMETVAATAKNVPRAAEKWSTTAEERRERHAAEAAEIVDQTQQQLTQIDYICRVVKGTSKQGNPACNREVISERVTIDHRLNQGETVKAAKEKAAKAREAADLKRKEARRANSVAEQTKAAWHGAEAEGSTDWQITHRKLQAATVQWKQAYVDQMQNAEAVAQIAQEEALAWAHKVAKMEWKHAEKGEAVIARTQVQVQR